MTSIAIFLFVIQLLFWIGGIFLAWRLTRSSAGERSRLVAGDRQPPNEPASFPGTRKPVTFFRPLKSGVVDLASKLDQFVKELEPGDEVLFGITSEQETEAIACLSLHRTDVTLRLIECQPDRMANPKVNKLSQLEPFATHDTWILLDAEAMPTANFLRAACQKHSGDAAVTAMYRFVPAARSPELADAIATTAFLWIGTVWKNSFCGNADVFGACLVVSRAMIEKCGGWRRFGDYLADDFRIGQTLRKNGFRIEFVPEPIALSSDRLGWMDFLLHQQRVAVTYRACAGASYFGSFLTQALPCSLVAAFDSVDLGISLLLLSLLLRSGTYTLAARSLGMKIPFLSALRLSPILLTVEFVAWIASWLPLPIFWGNRTLLVNSDGTMENRSTTIAEPLTDPQSPSTN